MKIKEEFRKCYYCKYSAPKKDWLTNYNTSKMTCLRLNKTIRWYLFCNQFEIADIYKDEAYED